MKTYTFWMFLALAFGLLIPNLVPGTSRDSYFLQCMANPSSHLSFQVFKHPWLWLPSLVLALWPFDIRIRPIGLTIGRIARIKIAFWLWLVGISAPWIAGMLLANPMRIIYEVICEFQTPVFQHGPNFCDVFDSTPWEGLTLLLLLLFHCTIYFFGISAGVRNSLRLCNLRPSWMLYVQDKGSSFSASCCFLIVAFIVGDITARVAWAQSCIHQGFH